MKKLNDINKENIFKVPPEYFDDLPGRIQSKISETSTVEATPYRKYGLAYALPVVILVACAIYFFTVEKEVAKPVSALEILNTIDTPSLVQYIAESETTFDDPLDGYTLSDSELDQLEDDINDPEQNIEFKSGDSVNNKIL